MDLAKVEGVAILCHSGNLLEVHWNSYKVDKETMIRYRYNQIPHPAVHIKSVDSCIKV